jgi:L-iditol 2-dehydrogenase
MKANGYALYGKEDLREYWWELPELEDGAVLLRVNACGICGSDLRMYYEGPSPRYKLPVVLGHEFTGTVIEAGSKVQGLNIGDIVAVAPLIPCLRCRPCTHGRDNLCESGQVIGVHIPGGIANFFYVSEKMVSVGGLARLPEGVDTRVGAMTEIVACCLHGLRQTSMEPGQSVLIVGEGPVGLAHLQLLRLFGAGQIIVTGLSRNRLDLAMELGASEVIDVGNRDLRQYAQDKGFRPDLAIIAAPVVPPTRAALEILRLGGSLLLFSGYPPETAMPFDLYKFHYSEKHIHGSIDCTLSDFHKAAELMPRLQMDRLVTSAFPLSEAPGAFRAARGELAVKTLIEVNSG